MININQNLGVRGEYNAILKNKDGEITYESGFKHNLILDSFFTNASGTWGNMRLKVGSGTTPPSAGQTGLVSMIGHTNSASNLSATTTTNGTTWTTTQSWTFTFTLGSIVGAVSELGLYFGAFESTVTNATRTRALILDNNQQPTTLTVTSSDQLVIIYRILVSGSEADSTGNITFTGSNTTHAYTIRRANGVSSANNNELPRYFNGNVLGMANMYGPSGTSLGAVGQGVVGSAEGSGSNTYDFSVTGRVRVTTSLSASLGNFAGGLAFMAPTSAIGWKIQFNPPLPKDNTKTLSLVSEYTYTRA